MSGPSPDLTPILAAFRAAFPSVESLQGFCDEGENGPALESLLQCAADNGLIEQADPHQLQRLIAAHEQATPAPSNLGFERWIDDRQRHLQLSLSVRAWTDRINGLLDRYQLELPRVGNSMLTRLKKEPADTLYKQNVLRSLAFWIGHERAEQSAQWHYQTLVQLCSQNKRQEHYTQGVRVGFSLSSRGDLIDQQVVSWLRKTLKQHLEQPSSQRLSGRWGKPRAHDITTLYIDIPEENGSGTPLAYRQSLRRAISLAHQIAISWALSEYAGLKRFLSIGVVTGEFGNLDSYLLPLLNAQLPGDPVIRVSDFTRQCLLINDIRVLCGERHTEIPLFSGEVLAAWPLHALWSFIYFDFAPDLQLDPLLNRPGSADASDRQPIDQEAAARQDAQTPRTDAIGRFLRTPANAMLGIEIAKSLYFRHRFVEAIEILRILLSIDPRDLIARTLRLMIYRNMAVESATLSGADTLFRMAEQEAHLIEQQDNLLPEDFYCEHGVVALARALTRIRFQRRQAEAAGSETETLAALSADLLQAQERFERGITVSPSGIRSAYLLGSARLLQGLISQSPQQLLEDTGPLTMATALARQQCNDLLRMRGYPVDSAASEPNFQQMEQQLHEKFRFHSDSIALRAYRPTLYFTAAVTLWDYTPRRTVGLARQALAYLKEAQQLARDLKADGTQIYSFSRIYGEVQPPDDFIEQMETAIRLIRRVCGAALQSQADQRPLADREQIELLMFANFPI